MPETPYPITLKQMQQNFAYLKIPEYQRHYCWKKPQITQFFNDLTNDMDKWHYMTEDGRGNPNKSKSIFGMIIGRRATDNTGEEYLEIIDGQQRITTLNMILLCLWYFAKNRKNTKVMDDDNVTDLKKLFTRKKPYRNNPLMLLNYDDAEYWNLLFEKVFDSEGNNKGNLKQVKNDFKNIKKKYGKRAADQTLLQKGFQSCYEIVETYVNAIDDYKIKKLRGEGVSEEKIISFIDKMKSQKMLNLAEWVEGSDSYGLQFTLVEEKTIPAALMRFDRENNRGIGVALDDLVKTYLIEGLENFPEKKKGEKRKAKDKILDSWKNLHKKVKKIEKKKLIQWYLTYKTGNWDIAETATRKDLSTILRYNLDPDNFEGTLLEAWNPVKIAEEISEWVDTYYKLIQKIKGRGSSVYYNLKFLESLKSPWALVLPLAIVCQKREKFNGIEVDERCKNLPKELMAELEYCLITQILVDKYSGNDWEKLYRQCASETGIFANNLTKEDIAIRGMKKVQKINKAKNLEDLIDKIHNMIKQENIMPTIDKFIEKYNDEETRSKWASNTSLSTERRAAHVRMLSQAEYHLNPSGTVSVEDIAPTANNLEHIFPKSEVKAPSNWSNDTKYNKNDIEELKLRLQCVGNHTIINHDFNKKISDDSFEEKRFGSPGKFIILENGQRIIPCYFNEGLDITKSLTNSGLQKFTSTFVDKRSDAIINCWGLYSYTKARESSSNKNVESILKYKPDPMLDFTERTKSRICEDESFNLEFKEVYWNSSKGKPDKTNDEMPTRIVNTITAFANTKGGDLIIGRQNKLSNLAEINGINSLIEYYEKKGSNMEYLINEISNDISERIPEKFGSLWVMKFVDVNGGKKVLHIYVKKYEGKGKVVCHPPRRGESINSQIYFARPAAQNKPYRIHNSEGSVFDDGILLEKYNNRNEKNVVIGPFKSENLASKFLRKLKRKEWITEANTKNNSATFVPFAKNQHIKWIAKGMFKSGDWKCTDKDKRSDGCYIVNLYNVPGDWSLKGYHSKEENANNRNSKSNNIESSGTQKEQVWNHIEDYMDTNNVWQFERANILKEGLNSYMAEWKADNPGQNLTRILLELNKEGKIKRVKKGIYEVT